MKARQWDVSCPHTADRCRGTRHNDLAGIQRDTDKRSGVIASAAPQVIGFAKGIPAEESLCDEQPASGVLFQFPAEILPDIILVRFLFPVDPHKIKRR